MRKPALAVLAIAAIAGFCVQSNLSAQDNQQQDNGRDRVHLQGYSTHIPWDGGTQNSTTQGNGNQNNSLTHLTSGFTIPTFNYSITSTKDNTTRTGTMVGSGPFATPLTSSSVSTVIVPLKVTIGTTVFDPTAPNSCDSNATTVSRFTTSPLIAGVSNLTINGINVGGASNTQFVNGFRRAEFWSTIGGSAAYQNTLSPVVTAAEVSLSPGKYGITYSSGCSQLGIVSYNWLDSYLKSTVMPSLTSSGVISPASFVIFLLRNVVQSTSNTPSVSNCCILGYHSATGSAIQTYATVDWDTTGDFGSAVADGSAASHEIAEFMDDPLGTNATPAWGNIGQVSGCQGNLEVGDPLSGTLMPGYVVGGYTFHMQELGFFSWYFNKLGVTSLGAGGKFSSNGKFAGPSKACPPGGTN